MNSARAHTHTVNLGDISVEHADEGNGPAIVLLPGGGLDISYLAPLAMTLAQSGHRAIRINPRFAGSSDGPPGPSMHDLADDIARLLRYLDITSAHLVGHAFGNRLARCVATDHPSLIASVTLLAAGGQVAPSAEAAAALQSLFDPTISDDEAVAAMAFAVGTNENAASAWRTLQPALSPALAAAEQRALHVTPATEWGAPVAQIPYLVVQGTADLIAPAANGEQLARTSEASVELVELDGAGHLMAITRPEETADAIVRFVRRWAPDPNEVEQS